MERKSMTYGELTEVVQRICKEQGYITENDLMDAFGVDRRTARFQMKHYVTPIIYESSEFGLPKHKWIRKPPRKTKAQREKDKADQKAWYQRYIQSDKWQSKRKEALVYYGYSCCRCHSTNVQLDVHHKSYENLGAESMDQLEVLCRSCHEKKHKK